MNIFLKYDDQLRSDKFRQKLKSLRRVTNVQCMLFHKVSLPEIYQYTVHHSLFK